MSTITITLRDEDKSFAGVSGEPQVFKLGCYTGQVLDVEDALFNTGSAVVLPNDGSCDPAAPDVLRTEGVKMIAVCLDQHARFPDQMALVVGHTDTVGSDDDNYELSMLRANNVLALLIGDKDLWVQTAVDKHVDDDLRAILTWIAGHFAIDCKPGKKLSRALEAFQVAEAIDPKGATADADTWGAIYERYQTILGTLLKLTAAELTELQTSLTFVDDTKPALGCGERYPKLAPGQDNHDAAENRRVEVFFFDPGEEPFFDCPEDEPCPTEDLDLYDSRFYVHERIPCEVKDPPRVFTVGTDDSGTGLFSTDAHLEPPFQFLREFEVEVEVKDRDLPARIMVRRDDTEDAVAWASTCPDLVFRNGKLNFKLATQDGPEGLPTGHVEPDRVVISGVQHGDVLIVEELDTPGKGKGRAEVCVVKNFTWNDWNRCGGQLGFKGPLADLDAPIKTQLLGLVEFMLAQGSGTAQAQQRQAIKLRIDQDPPDADDTGRGKLRGNSAVFATGNKADVCSLPVPSCRGVGRFPNDWAHLHLMGRSSMAVALKLSGEVGKELDARAVDLGLEDFTGLEVEEQREAVVDYIEGHLSRVVDLFEAAGKTAIPYVFAHSYEGLDAAGAKYLTAPSASKLLTDGDPVRNVELILGGGKPELYDGHPTDSNNYRREGKGHAEVQEFQILINRDLELVLWATPRTKARMFFGTRPYLAQVADALGEFQ